MQIDIRVGEFLQCTAGQFRAQIRAANTNIDNIGYRFAGAANPVATAYFFTDQFYLAQLLFYQTDTLVGFLCS